MTEHCAPYPQEKPPVRVLSYNIHKGIGGYDRCYRLQRIIDVIQAEEPDLICLQEVDRNVKRTRFDDQPALLADYFAANAMNYQLNVPLQAGGYGNLVLSRWPMHTENHVCLRLGRRKPRGAQVLVVNAPQGQFHLINWHLGLREKERRWQAEQLLRHEHFVAGAEHPTLIVGDFNDWRNKLAAHIFARHGFHQVTDPARKFRSFPAYWPVIALDKAFVRGNLQVQEAKVIRTSLTRKASDHLPLCLDVQLPAPVIS